jgi:hypothetical protein
VTKATTTVDIFCITDVPKELDLKLEDSFLLKALLYNPEDKALAKDVAQKIQKFYLRDISNSAAVFSSAGDVRNDFVFLISDFRRNVYDICALLGCYTVSCDKCSTTFRDNVSVPSSRVKSPSRKERKPATYNTDSMKMCTFPEECRSQFSSLFT